MVEYIYKGQIYLGQSNLPSFLATAQHLEISGLDQLKTGDSDGSREVDQDQGMRPQDLSMKTQLSTKRRRVSESYQAYEPGQGSSNLVRNNVFTSQAHCVSSTLQYNKFLNTLRLPTGIFPQNLEKLNDDTSTNKQKVKES